MPRLFTRFRRLLDFSAACGRFNHKAPPFK